MYVILLWDVNSSYDILWQKGVSGIFSFFSTHYDNSVLKGSEWSGYSAVRQLAHSFVLQIVSDIASSSFVKGDEITSFPMNIEG